MVRLLLFLVLFIVIARVFWRFVDNVIEAAGGQPRSSRPQVPQSVQMVRDPVCGTFVLPERAVALTDGRSSVYFCSAACRDRYRAGPSAGPGRPQSAPGRTA